MKHNLNNAPRLYKAPEPIKYNKLLFYIGVIIFFLLFWFVGSVFNNNIDMLLSNCI